MTDYEPYSRRQKQSEQAAESTPLRYDHLPREFRVQAFQILDDIIGRPRSSGNMVRSFTSGQPTPDEVWDAIHDGIARERGVFDLHERRDIYGIQVHEKDEQIRQYLVYNDDEPTPYLLDAIEFAFRAVNKISHIIAGYQHEFASRLRPKQGSEELNRRFREHALGYSFDMSSGMIVRVDSEYLHAEAVEPATRILRRVGFEGAEAEVQRAQEHHRHGRYEEAMADALKAFESTMKYICDQRGWAYNPDRDTASRLIDVLLQEGLLPSWVQSEFTSLRTLLESGVPTARNRVAGHGRGAARRQVPEYLAAFALHMTGANIVFLVEAFFSLPSAKD